MTDRFWLKHPLPPELSTTLAAITSAASELQDDWWIIGSAAMALIGLCEVSVRDVDLLTSSRDAQTLFYRWQCEGKPPEATSSGLFRSLFGQCTQTPLPIEVMGNLEVWSETGWMRLRPQSRVEIDTPSGTFFVPSRAEQIAILQQFGRPKDLLRAKALANLQEPASN